MGYPHVGRLLPCSLQGLHDWTGAGHSCLVYALTSPQLHVPVTNKFLIALALGQLGTKVVAFQWIFAFIIAGILFVFSIAVAAPKLFGASRSARQEGAIVSEDRERAPLLADDQ